MAVKVVHSDSQAVNVSSVNCVVKFSGDNYYALKVYCTYELIWLTFDTLDERDKFYKELVDAMGA